MTAAILTSAVFNDPDQVLVRQAAAGDVKAFQRLFEQHHRRVYGLVLRLAGDVDTAQDLTQDVFIQLWNNLRSFRGESKFSTWLHTVATRVAITELRKHRRWFRALNFSDDDDYQQRLVHEDSADLGELDILIRRLPPQTRWVFVLHCLEGMRHEDIARELGIAVGTSKAQLHRARSLLEGWLSHDSE